MCHDATRQTRVKFAPELMVAGLSVTPAHVEKRGRRAAACPAHSRHTLQRLDRARVVTEFCVRVCV